MKKVGDIAVIMVLVIVMAVVINSTVHAKTVAHDEVNGYEVKITQSKNYTYILWNNRRYAKFRGHYKVRIVDNGIVYQYKNNRRVKLGMKLTERSLMKRKGKVIYIEKMYGHVTNKYLDGITTDGYYLCYSRLKGKVKPGDKVVTYNVFDPTTHWIDDFYRFDVPLKYHR